MRIRRVANRLVPPEVRQSVIAACHGRVSVQSLRARGWTRVDDGSHGKIGALWRHASGWTVQHCGHPTALHPWDLYDPKGHQVLTGILRGDPSLGVAWNTLGMVALYVDFASRTDAAFE